MLRTKNRNRRKSRRSKKRKKTGNYIKTVKPFEKKAPNRLQLLKQWVGEGGGFCMYSGYLSFAGFQAAAKYYRTPIEEILPVDIYPFDDRVETPEGAEVEVVEPDHLVLDGVGNKRPHLLGYQETKLKASVKLLTRTQHGHPLLAVMDYGKGRTLAWMSDIGPHWCPKLIVEWKGYNRIWQQAAQCLAGRI